MRHLLPAIALVFLSCSRETPLPPKPDTFRPTIERYNAIDGSAMELPRGYRFMFEMQERMNEYSGRYVALKSNIAEVSVDGDSSVVLLNGAFADYVLRGNRAILDSLRNESPHRMFTPYGFIALIDSWRTITVTGAVSEEKPEPALSSMRLLVRGRFIHFQKL